MAGKSINYDQLAVEYALHRKAVPEVVQQLIATASIHQGSRVLEAGCGTGNYLAAIFERTGCSAWGCDPSPEMLKEARMQLSPDQILDGRGEALPFPDASFDLIFSVDVIHHMADPGQYFRDAYRVLRADGKICTVTESSDHIRKRIPFAKYFPETVTVDLHRYPSILALKTMMRSSGFTNIQPHILKLRSERTNLHDFRDRAYSCLHLISDEAFEQGMKRMEQDLQKGAIPFIAPYLLLWGSKIQA